MHSATEKIPLWVAEYIEKSQLTGSLARADKFQPDPLLKPGRRAELIDYKGSGYDRGHQAPAGDQTVDARLKAETFYLSNMAPQVPALNQQAWRELETLVRNWILERGSGYVITGPMFYDTNKTNTQPGGDIADYKAIGPDRVAVPTHFFKIVVAKDANGRWQSIAFVLENRKYTKPYDFAKDIKSITWIEQHTGINFMPQLDALEQRRMEASASPMWN
jgi:endonuclease G